MESRKKRLLNAQGWYSISSENREGGCPEMVVGSWGKENELRVIKIKEI